MYVAAVVLWILGLLSLAWGALSKPKTALSHLVARYTVGSLLFAAGCGLFLFDYLSRPIP